MHIVCIKEFRDEFNPYASNITNNNVNFRTHSILTVSTYEDSSHHTFPAGYCDKSKDNMMNEQTQVYTYVKVSNPVNGKKYYSKQLRKCNQIVLCDIGIMMDQPGKRIQTNFAGGNSDYGAKFGHR